MLDLPVPEPCHDDQIPMLVHHLEHASGSARAPEVPCDGVGSGALAGRIT